VHLIQGCTFLFFVVALMLFRAELLLCLLSCVAKPEPDTAGRCGQPLGVRNSRQQPHDWLEPQSCSFCALWHSRSVVITLRAGCSAVYCYRSCLWVCLCVCGSVTMITQNCVHWSSPNCVYR